MPQRTPLHPLHSCFRVNLLFVGSHLIKVVPSTSSTRPSWVCMSAADIQLGRSRNLLSSSLSPHLTDRQHSFMTSQQGFHRSNRACPQIPWPRFRDVAKHVAYWTIITVVATHAVSETLLRENECWGELSRNGDGWKESHVWLLHYDIFDTVSIHSHNPTNESSSYIALPVLP